MAPGVDPLERLNERQRKAVTYGEGPLLIVAGAGSGKTLTLAHRVAHLVSKGVRPERILLLTFTRRASEEMLKRAAAVLSSGSSVSRRAWGGTFHATATRLIRIYASSASLSPQFTVLDRTDAEDLLDVVRHELGFSKTGQRFPRKSTCMDIYSRKVNSAESLTDLLARHFPWCSMWEVELKRLFKSFAERKLQQQVLDYDDLLLYWFHLLQEPAVARSMGDRFEHILVDEYQDTNRIQGLILEGMRQHNRNITAVGDDAQSIYAFRSATVRNILDFPARFPGATVIKLEENYRSTPEILNTTNRLIAQASERYTKDLRTSRRSGQKPFVCTCSDEAAQDEAVIARVLEHREQGIPLRRQAVLFRSAHHTDSLELALTRRHIPFHKYGGLKFLETGHIKDVLALLRITENPRDDVAWFRVLQMLPGVGPVTAQAAIAHVHAHGDDPASLAGFDAPTAAREDLSMLAEMFGDLFLLDDGGPAAKLDRILKTYTPLLNRMYDNPGPRVADIENLARLASECTSTERFLADMVLDPPVSTADLSGAPVKDEDWLVLSTVHSAKGLEWDVVYLIHAADGCLPSDMATGSRAEIDEELRLAYVAMTRARDFLYVLWPLRYYHRPGPMTDSHSYAQRSRFLNDAVLQTMVAVSYSNPGAADDRAERANGPRVDIAARIIQSWD